MCISFNAAPAICIHALHSVSYFIANEEREREKNSPYFSSYRLLYSDWKIEHSNSCNSKSIWAMQSLPPTLLRFLFCFYHFICIVVLHVSFMTALFEKCCAARIRRGFQTNVVLFIRFVLLFHILKLGNLTHPITVLFRTPYSRPLAQFVRKVKCAPFQLNRPTLDIRMVFASEVSNFFDHRRRRLGI